MICDIEGCDEHYACKLRAKTLQVSPQATPSTANWRRKTPDPPSWEKGKVMFDRPNGYKMPLLNPDMSPVHVKQGAEQRHRINDLRQAQAAAISRSS